MLYFTISGIYEKFADAFVKACEGLKVGNGFEKGVSLVILLSLSLTLSFHLNFLFSVYVFI